MEQANHRVKHIHMLTSPALTEQRVGKEPHGTTQHAPTGISLKMCKTIPNVVAGHICLQERHTLEQ